MADREFVFVQDREAVFPTRQSLGIMKAKLKGAETGHSLLKRKSEALTKYASLISQNDFSSRGLIADILCIVDDSEVRRFTPFLSCAG